MWPNLQFPADLVTLTGEILNGKLHLLGSDSFIDKNEYVKRNRAVEFESLATSLDKFVH